MDLCGAEAGFRTRATASIGAFYSLVAKCATILILHHNPQICIWLNAQEEFAELLISYSPVFSELEMFSCIPYRDNIHRLMKSKIDDAPSGELLSQD
jgi:hypothetical protein